MRMRTCQPVNIHAHTHTPNKRLLSVRWFSCIFLGLMQVRQTWLQAIYHLRIIKVKTYEPWFSTHRQSCNNSKSYRSIYHIYIDHLGTFKRGWLDYIWIVLMYQPCTAHFQKSETTWNNKSSRLDLFPSLTFGCSFPLQEKNKRKRVYTIYVAPNSTKQTIYTTKQPTKSTDIFQQGNWLKF